MAVSAVGISRKNIEKQIIFFLPVRSEIMPVNGDSKATASNVMLTSKPVSLLLVLNSICMSGNTVWMAYMLMNAQNPTIQRIPLVVLVPKLSEK